MSKKTLIPVVVVVLMIVVAAVIGFMKLRPQSQPEEAVTGKKKAVEQLNVIPVAERPVITIHPESDGHNITLTLVTQKKTATEVEYELEYQAGSLLQGAFGKLKLDSLPSSTKILLGSCSAGGACTFHEDVQGGTLLTRYSDSNDYALKSDWRYFENKQKNDQIASKDAKFQLTADSLAKQGYIIVFNSPGYPEGLEGTPASEIFSLETSSTLTGDGELILRTDLEGITTVAVWDGTEWQYVEGTADGKTLTAEVPLTSLYLAVSK